MILFRPIFGVKMPIFGLLPPNSTFLFHWGPSAPTPLISAPIYGVFWGVLGSFGVKRVGFGVEALP